MLPKLDMDTINVESLPADLSIKSSIDVLAEINPPPDSQDQTDLSNIGRESVESLADKMDNMTRKMDRVLEYLVADKSRSDTRNQINTAKFKLLEQSQNNVIDKLSHIDLNLVECAAKAAQNSINIESNEECLTSLQSQVRLLKACVNDKDEKMNDLMGQMKKIQKDINATKSSVLDLGQEVRDKRLIISGVDEQKNEDTVGLAMDNLNLILADAISQYAADPQHPSRRPKFRLLVIEDIDNAYRVGKPPIGKKYARSISVSFSVGYLKHMIFSARSYMKSKPKGFFINEDLRQDARDLRSDLKKIAAGAKSLGMDTKISGNKISIDNEVYTPEELPAVEDDVLEAAKQQKSIKNGIVFKGDRSIFSNFFPAPISIDGSDYAHVEQYFQYVKATECGYTRLARKVLLKDNPWYCKTVGGRATPTDNWRSMRMRTLYRGIYAKFDQHGPLKQALMDTEGVNLYEATTDLYWGCGIDFDSDKWETGDWPGENVCGKILVKVREEFLRECNLGSQTDDTITDLEITSMVSSPAPRAAPNLDLSDTSRMETNHIRPSQQSNDDWPVVGGNSEGHQVQSEPSLEGGAESGNSPGTSYKQAVSSTPKLTKVIPQITRGIISNNSKSGKGGKAKFPPTKERMSNDDRAFLDCEANNTPGEIYATDHGSKNSALNGNSKSKKKKNRKPKKGNSSNKGNLSPKQKQAIEYLGIGPNSEFVKSIITAKGQKGK